MRQSREKRRIRRLKAASYAGIYGANRAARKFRITAATIRKACREFGVLLPAGRAGYSASNRNGRGYRTYQILARLIESPKAREVEIAREFGVTPQMVQIISQRARRSGVFEAVRKCRREAW